MGLCIMAWQVSTAIEFTIVALCVMLGTAFFLFLVDDELGHLSPTSADPSPHSPLSWYAGTDAQSAKVKV